MSCGSLHGRGVWGRVWLSPFAVHLKLSQDYESAVLQYKIKILKQNYQIIVTD